MKDNEEDDDKELSRENARKSVKERIEEGSFYPRLIWGIGLVVLVVIINLLRD
jgi:hypothetical protein